MHPELQALLTERIGVIADHSFRDRDPTAHLQALKDVSEKIEQVKARDMQLFDKKLQHYLANSSYEKALNHIQAAS